AGERAERLEAQALGLAKRQYLVLGVAVEQRVRVLDEVVAPRPTQELAVDVAATDRAHLPLADEFVEGGERVPERRVRIGLVGQVHVDTLDAETAQAPLELPADPLGREAVVGRVALDGVEDLRA